MFKWSVKRPPPLSVRRSPILIRWMRNVLSELVIHLRNPLYLHLPALFSSTNPPPLSLVTINNQGIRSEFVILTPAQCDINHLISLVELNVCVWDYEQHCRMFNKKGQSEFNLKRIFKLKNITKYPSIWIQWSHTASNDLVSLDALREPNHSIKLLWNDGEVNTLSVMFVSVCMF